MEKKRLVKYALYGIPVLVGVFLIVKQFTKKSAAVKEDVPPPPKSLPPRSDFPLSVGSRNETVRQLQVILNTALANKKQTLLVTDGIFGSKTEAALKSITGKSSVANQVELEAIKNQISSTSSVSANLDWAWQLIDAYNSGRHTNLVVRKPIKLIKIQKNFQGLWKPVGINFTMNPMRYNLVDYALRSAMNDGTLRIEITRGQYAGMWATEPSETLFNALDLE